MPKTNKKTKTSKTAKSRPKTQPEAIAMLVRDHEMVKAMFDEFEELEDDDSKKQLADTHHADEEARSLVARDGSRLRVAHVAARGG